MLITFCLAWSSASLAASPSWKGIPLPPPRPADAAVRPAAPAGPAAKSELCAALLGAGTFEGDIQPPVTASGGCGIAAPVLLKAIVLPGGKKIVVEPPALMRCTLAAAVAEWVRTDVAPAIVKEAAPLAKIEVAGAYECRGRNRVASAKMSEHGKGNAFDMRAFVSERGQRFEIAKQNAALGFFRAVKQSACGRFMTVLGPGSDGFHESHLHVDLQERARGSHFCQWSID